MKTHHQKCHKQYGSSKDHHQNDSRQTRNKHTGCESCHTGMVDEFKKCFL